MTRKDYILLAAALKGAREWNDRAANTVSFVHGLDAAIHAIANALATDNARFDRARFLTAAGVEA